ncbi:hypothetical protein JW835_01555 [bacterium]|nr:hypothetical protein [bacterium]
MNRLYVIVYAGLFLMAAVFAQENSTSASQDSSQTGFQGNGELILDEIEIQGQIEKPGVIVLPRRVDPEIGQVELGRSFDNELKNGVEALPKPDKVLGQVDDVKSIKKAVERQRN